MRVGIAHHYGWAVAVTASDAHRVMDRRRIELIGPGLPAAPIHHEGGTHELHSSPKPMSDSELTRLVQDVRSSAVRSVREAFADIASSVQGSIRSISLRAWPADFPTRISELRRPPFESQADSVMYRQVLAEVARTRGWAVHLFSGATAEAEATALLGDRADAVLHGPRRTIGPPWNKDHRMALAATVLAAHLKAGD